MNGHQFKALLEDKYAVQSTYWAPEIAVAKFRDSVWFQKDDTYQLAVMVLCENATAFKQRITGAIQDQWLNAGTFASIARQMVLAMENVVKLADTYPNNEHYRVADWQLELLALLRTFQ